MAKNRWADYPKVASYLCGRRRVHIMEGPENRRLWLLEEKLPPMLPRPAYGHPNLLQVLDQTVEGGRAFTLVAPPQGPSLFQVLEQSGPLPPAGALAIAAQVAEALDHLHNLVPPWVVGCLSPRWVHVEADRRVRLNFLAVAAGPQPAPAAVLDPGFTAPEVDPTPRSDVYSLGRILAALVGEAPGQGVVAELIAWSTRTDPAQRPASARRLRQALAQCQAALAFPVESGLGSPAQATEAGRGRSADADATEAGRGRSADADATEVGRGRSADADATEAERGRSAGTGAAAAGRRRGAQAGAGSGKPSPRPSSEKAPSRKRRTGGEKSAGKGAKSGQSKARGSSTGTRSRSGGRARRGRRQFSRGKGGWGEQLYQIGQEVVGSAAEVPALFRGHLQRVGKRFEALGRMLGGGPPEQDRTADGTKAGSGAEGPAARDGTLVLMVVVVLVLAAFLLLQALPNRKGSGSQGQHPRQGQQVASAALDG